MSGGLKEKAEALLKAERGTVFKARRAAVEIALAYPNTYHIGMSNLGVHQMYSVLNQRSDTACERVFLPDAEDLPAYARSGTELFSLESRRPVRQFDILAFSVSFERFRNLTLRAHVDNSPTTGYLETDEITCFHGPKLKDPYEITLI